MSNYTNKSDMYLDVAELAENNYKYPAVAHCAYYSCFHLMQHIWYHKMGKTERQLEIECSTNKTGKHNILINEVACFIKNNPKNRNAQSDFQLFNSKIIQLKKLRESADYKDEIFDITKSIKSRTLARELIPILKRT